MWAIDSITDLTSTLSHGSGIIMASAVGLVVLFAMIVFRPRPNTGCNDRAGQAGERRVAGVIRASGLAAVHDVYLRIGRSTTQIDHVVASGRSLLVIETKNFSGAIYGRAEDREWLQVRSDGRRRFRNPLLQNRTHVEAVRLCAGGRVEGIVVFAGSAVFPKGVPHGVLVLDRLTERLERRGPASFFCRRRFARLQRRLSRMDRDKARIAHLHTLRRARSSS